MIHTGKIVKSDSGRRIRVDGPIAAGGQGEAYHASDMDTGEKGVLKVFYSSFDSGNTAKRLRFLIDQDLGSLCPVLCPPKDLLSRAGILGHYARFAPGQSMEEFLGNPSSTFIEELQLAVSLAHAIAVLHEQGIAHGDLRAENLIVNRTRDALELYLIDLDNFNAPGMPPPPMVGETLYMAPELQEALAQSRAAVPDRCTDAFALGVLMHEILLLRHVAAGADDSEADFHKAMRSGRWLHDPAAADRPRGALGGYPAEVLNVDLARLIRAALSLDRHERPSAIQWESALWQAFNSVYSCPSCRAPCIIDASKTACPLCRTPYPALALLAADGVRVPLDSGAVVVGRDLFRGAVKVSSLHAVFRRIGPDTWIQPHGRNGTYRWNGSGWTKLAEGKSYLVQRGDRLRFADLEVRLG